MHYYTLTVICIITSSLKKNARKSGLYVWGSLLILSHKIKWVSWLKYYIIRDVLFFLAKHCVFKLPLPEHEGKCSTDTSTVISQSECKESCHVDNTCRGFTYDTSRNICQQHDCPSSEKEGRLSTIYVRKLCGCK